MPSEDGSAPRWENEGPVEPNADDSNLSGPYARAAKLYRENGWLGIWPLPFNAKSAPPEGYNTRWPSSNEIDEWVVKRASGNVALRLPPGMIAIDIDAWKDGKEGARETLQRLEEKCGKLPATWSITSRGGASASRKLLYRIPDRVILVGQLAGVGELIQSHHRYAVTWPSTNPDDAGNIVYWYTPDGQRYDGVPHVDEVSAILPKDWQTELAKGSNGNHATGRELLGDHKAAHSYREMLDDAVASVEAGATRYDTGCNLAIRMQANHLPEHDAELYLGWFRERGYSDDELSEPGHYKKTVVKWLDLAYRKVPSGGREAEPYFEAIRTSSSLTDWAARQSAGTSDVETETETETEVEAQEPTTPFFQSTHAMRNRPPLKWIVDGILPERALGQIFGQTGEYKSFVLIDLMYQISNGPEGNFLGKQVLTDGPGLCAMVLGEGGGDIGERVDAWCLANPTLNTDHTFFTVDEDLDLLNAKDVQRIGEQMMELRDSSGLPWRVIAFDTQADHMPGGDERNETTFSTLKKHLLVLSRVTNAAIMLVHHTGYDESRERGSSRQRQMLDVVWGVKENIITFEKIKAGPKPKPLPFAVREQANSLYVAEPSDFEMLNMQLDKDSESLDKALTALRKLGGLASQSALVDEASMSKNTLQRLATAFPTKLKREPVSGNSVRYSIPT